MKNYTRTYLNYFGLDVSSFVSCEICGGKAVDIHHIEARSKRKDLEDDINNLQALCRKCHEDYGDRKEFKEKLQEVHNKYMEIYGKKSCRE
jgi:5-methylcytosine-specific restriction endonuclease McrA